MPQKPSDRSVRRIHGDLVVPTARLSPGEEVDLAGAERDAAATARDQAAADRDASPATGDAHTIAMLQREAARDRAAAALDRREAALEREQARQYLRNAYRDRLTGALQRQAGRDQLAMGVDHARRTGQPLVVAFLDVDGLKQRNDDEGHAAGDKLLVALGAALRSSLRSYDLVIRYGGDEFVCCLPDVELPKAADLFVRVAYALDRELAGATASVGLAQLREGDTVDDVLNRADMAMYEARRHKRERTGIPLRRRRS